MLNPSSTYVLGAGPAGLAAAYTLTQKEQPVVIIEQQSKVGGLSSSIDYEGFILDYGPHFFGTSIPSVLKLWHDVLGTEQVSFTRIVRMYWRNKYFSYPPKPIEILLGLRFFESLKVIASYLQAQLSSKVNPQNLAEQTVARFGEELFQIFFKDYMEKLWGIPCSEISSDWQPGQMQYNSSLIKLLKNIIWKPQEAKQLHPRLGTKQFYDRMLELIKLQNQAILLNHKIVQINHNNFKVNEIILQNNQTKQEEKIDIKGQVISSIPLNILLKIFSPLPPDDVLEQLKFLKIRNTVLVYVIVESSELFLDQCLYINDPSIGLGRVTNFANWSEDMRPNSYQTPLCCEYWCNFSDPIWEQPEEEIIDQCIQDLKTIEVLHDEKIFRAFVMRVPRTHPISDNNSKVALSKIKSYLDQFLNLQIIGRYGAFKYYDQDCSLMMGVEAATNIVDYC